MSRGFLKFFQISETCLHRQHIRRICRAVPLLTLSIIAPLMEFVKREFAGQLPSYHTRQHGSCEATCCSLLTLCSIAQVGMDYNRQTIQVSGKINKKIYVKKLLTKLLAGCIMVNSGRDARNRPAIIPCPGAFVNRENYTKNEGKTPLIFVRTDKREMRPAFRSGLRFRPPARQPFQPTDAHNACAMPAYHQD